MNSRPFALGVSCEPICSARLSRRKNEASRSRPGNSTAASSSAATSSETVERSFFRASSRRCTRISLPLRKLTSPQKRRRQGRLPGGFGDGGKAGYQLELHAVAMRRRPSPVIGGPGAEICPIEPKFEKLLAVQAIAKREVVEVLRCLILFRGCAGGVLNSAEALGSHPRGHKGARRKNTFQLRIRCIFGGRNDESRQVEPKVLPFAFRRPRAVRPFRIHSDAGRREITHGSAYR